MPLTMTANAPKTPAERVRERMARWLEVTGLTQREFADALQKTQVWLQKVLKGENDVRLRQLDEIARAMRTTAAELIRDDEERYQLELTPTEVRIMEQLRRAPESYAAIATLLHVPHLPPHSTATEPPPNRSVFGKRSRKN